MIDHDPARWYPLFDRAGVAVGTWKGRRPLTRAQQLVCADFLSSLISEERKKEIMAEKLASSKGQSEKKVFTSQCFIGGEVVKCGVDLERGGGYVLVNVGKASKFIFCDIYQDEKLAARLDKYDKGDHILLHGYVRAWSVKNDETEEWTNKTSVRVTDIRSKDPETQASRKEAAQGFTADDDDIPF